MSFLGISSIKQLMMTPSLQNAIELSNILLARMRARLLDCKRQYHDRFCGRIILPPATGTFILSQKSTFDCASCELLRVPFLA